MNPFDLLRSDHRAIGAIVASLQRGDGDQAALFARLRTALEVHSLIEEELLYAALDPHGEAKAALEDHDELRECLEIMREEQVGNKGWLGAVEKLKQLCDHHREHEEALFSKVRQRVSEPILADLGVTLQRRKEDLMALSDFEEDWEEAGRRVGRRTGRRSPQNS